MHMNEGELQAYLDGALDTKRRIGVAGHLAACADCAATLDELSRVAAVFSGAVTLLGAPESDAESDAEVVPFEPRARRGGNYLVGAGGAFLRAAAIILLVGGVAWGALPGSALRGWAGQLWDAGAALLAGGGGDQVVTPEPVVAAAALSGISILPDNGAARVVVREPDPALRLRVRVLAEPQVTVQWSGNGTDPSFRTAAGRIEVLGGGAGELLVEAPRGARVRVEVGGREIAVVEGGEVRRLVSAEADGNDVVFRSLSGGS